MIRAVAILGVVLAACGGGRGTSMDEHAVRRVVALIDYVAVDYGGAVRDGQVLDENEYKEQLAFLKEATERASALPSGKEDARAKLTMALDDVTERA